MKAIILAAGRGTRLKKYTKVLPKGMLKIGNKSIIERQIETMKNCGIDDIIIVKGYKQGKIKFPGVKYFINNRYKTTNMVESLFSAAAEFDTDIIISYADILYEERVLKKLINSEKISVVVDIAWKKYWKKRYGEIDTDIEGLKIDKSGNIIEIGHPDPELKEISGRYVGLIKFPVNKIKLIKNIYYKAKKKYANRPWQISGRNFEQAYMTDFINELIENKIDIAAVKIRHGWLEVDTEQDYEKVHKWIETNEIKQICDIKLNTASFIKVKLYKKYFNFDSLDIPVKYNESEFHGTSFIKEYLNIRERFLFSIEKFFSTEKNLSDIKVEVKKRFPPYQEISQDSKYINSEEYLAWSVISLLNKNKSRDMKMTVDSFLKRYEVSKKIYKKYSPDFKKKYGGYKKILNYIFLALCCAGFYERTKNLKYLNCLLKLNDMLITRDIKKLNVFEKLCLCYILTNEMKFIKQLMKKGKIII